MSTKKTTSFIHSTAIIEKGAKLGDGVHIGPYCYIGANVVLGDHVHCVAHVHIDGYTVIGQNVKIYPFAVVGQEPQHLGFKGEKSTIHVGARTIIREHVTIHPGTAVDNCQTIVGTDCLLMVGAHVAHDCIIGNSVIVANNTAIGGHVVIEDNAVIGGMVGIRQFVRVGRHSMIGGGTMLTKDVVPCGLCEGHPSYLTGINIIGLKRRGFTSDTIKSIRSVYKILCENAHLSTKIGAIEKNHGHVQEVRHMIDFMQKRSARTALCMPIIKSNNEKTTAAMKAALDDASDDDADHVDRGVSQHKVA